MRAGVPDDRTDWSRAAAALASGDDPADNR
jgi:hypothetical protein